MRALFVGGTVDNSELDLTHATPPVNYPSVSGSGQPRYRLHAVGQRNGVPIYAVYAAPNLASAEVERVVAERGYARRFGADNATRADS